MLSKTIKNKFNFAIVQFKNSKLSAFKDSIKSLYIKQKQKKEEKNDPFRYFKLEDLTVTSSRFDNTPTENDIKRLESLLVNVLNPLVEKYKFKITINSAFRSKAVNKAIGSKSKTSQHMFGEAADITCSDNKKLYNLILNNLDFDQLINESDFSWIHVSYTKRKKNRKQVLKM